MITVSHALLDFFLQQQKENQIKIPAQNLSLEDPCLLYSHSKTNVPQQNSTSHYKFLLLMSVIFIVFNLVL